MEGFSEKHRRSFPDPEASARRKQAADLYARADRVFRSGRKGPPPQLSALGALPPFPSPLPHAAAPGLRRSAFAPPHPNPYPPYSEFFVIGRGSGEGSWGSGRVPFYSPASAPARCIAAAPTATSSVVVFHPWPQSQLLGPFRARSLRRRPEALAVHRNYLVPTRF